jgi:photosystem II stability/assembly factor-like uncharacterized protein
VNLSRVGSLLIALLLPIQVFAGTKYLTRWSLFENQPNIEEGGRTQSIAVNPVNASVVFAASDSGGLFKSIDGGVKWKHVDSLPVIFTQAVVYATPDILLVSAKADFKIKNGGGIWRSVNGGTTWKQQELPIAGFTGRLSAYGISVYSTGVVAGTSQGVFLSDDRGATWTYSDVFGGERKAVHSVLITPTSPTRVYAAGPSGIRLGTNPAGTWQPPVLDPGAAGPILGIHAFARSPLAASQAFVVNGQGQLFRTDNNGSIWTLMHTAPPQGPCAGHAFIKATRRQPDTLDLYLGTRCGLHRLAAPVTQNTANFSGTWQAVSVDHPGTLDLSFFNGYPCVLASAGGVHRTVDGGSTWTLTGGGADGYNALQVTEIKGQRVGNELDLYFGTRDNNVWAMNGAGIVHNSHRSDGAYIELEPRVATEKDSQITFTASGNNRISGRHFEGAHDWNDFASLGHIGSPMLIRRPFHLQLTRGSQAFDPGLSILDETWGWREFANFPERAADNPRLGQSDGGDTSREAIVYQPVRNILGLPWASRLLRIHKRLVPTESATVFYPPADQIGSIGAIGTNPTMDGAWYSVFAVDPGDASHLIAPDVKNEVMLDSPNGGDDWLLIHDLNDKLASDGLLFVTDLTGAGPVNPLVTAISFSPQDPNLVLAGTNEGGIYHSDDRGLTWTKILGSERATYVTSFYWQTANMVYVSTFGRGIWKLKNGRVAVGLAFDDLCDSCDVVADTGAPDRPVFDGSVLAFEGRILGVRKEKSQLRELFVTPGSSVVFTGDLNDPQDDIVITESNGRETFDPLPAPDGFVTAAVVFTSGDTITGTAFAPAELNLLRAVYPKLGGSTESPSKGMPMIRVTTSSSDVVPTATPREAITLSGTDFLPAASYEIVIDGLPVKGTVTADGSGAFGMSLSAPSMPGAHTIGVRMVNEETLIDATAMFVRD